MEDLLAHLLQPELVSAPAHRYTLDRELGSGSMGVVFLAHDVLLDRQVAIKVMAASIAADATLRACFEREARAAARLSHPNVVTVHDFGYDAKGAPYVVMELLRGRDLRQALLAGAITIERRIAIVLEMLAGLADAHAAGIVHRDVKPANVFLTGDGGVKLLDFGIARLPRGAGSTGKDVMGTADYMSPEQILGATVDGRSDVFSCGSMLFELLTGRPPFHADNFVTIAYRVVNEEPEWSLLPAPWVRLQPVLRRALAKRLEERYAKVEELAADLVRHSGVSLPHAETPPPPQTVRFTPRPELAGERAAAARIGMATTIRLKDGSPRPDLQTTPTDLHPALGLWPLRSVVDDEDAEAKAVRPTRRRIGRMAGAACITVLPLLVWAAHARPSASLPGRESATLDRASIASAEGSGSAAAGIPAADYAGKGASAPAAAPTAALPAPVHNTVTGRWVGFLTDENCREKGAVNDHGACLEVCLRAGRRPLISIGGRLYRLIGFERIQGHNDRRVLVEGTLDLDRGLLTVERGRPAAR